MIVKPLGREESSDSVGGVSNGGDPNSRELTRKPWLASEDQTIIDSVHSMGFKWRVIAGMLPGRSDDAVRNRWNRLQEAMRDGMPPRLLGSDRPKAGYKCSKCGQPKRNHVCTYQPGSALAQQQVAQRPSNKRDDGDKLRVSWISTRTIRLSYVLDVSALDGLSSRPSSPAAQSTQYATDGIAYRIWRVGMP